MSNREYNPNWSRDDEPRRREGRDTYPEHDDYGLHSPERNQYRGRESYEQQSRSGQGGRSGLFEHRTYPRSPDDSRSYADEDRRPYQSISQRAELERSYRDRLGLQREGQGPGYRGDYRERDDESARYGFDNQDFTPGHNPREFSRDYGRGDYGRNDWGPRPSSNTGSPYSRPVRSSYDDYEPRRELGPRARDYSSSPYSEPQRSAYDRYDRGDYERGAQSRWTGQGGQDYGQRWSGGGLSWTGPSSDAARYGTGEYAQSVLRRGGKGPKGYKRSDERIREDVCDRLSHQWDLDSSEVEVTVSNGEVTLTGTIADREQKHRAENVADAVSGVNEVHNQLRIKRELSLQSDRDAAQSTSGSAGTKPSSQSTRHS